MGFIKDIMSPSNNMVDYTLWPIILTNMKAIKPTTSEELSSQSITIIKNAWKYSSPTTPTQKLAG
jgi:hypothetical protein